MSLKCSPPIVYSPKIYADYVACFFEKEKRGVINIKLRPYYRFLQTPFKQLYNVHTLSILTVPTNYSCTIHYINSRGLQFSKLDRIRKIYEKSKNVQFLKNMHSQFAKGLL